LTTKKAYAFSSFVIVISTYTTFLIFASVSAFTKNVKIAGLLGEISKVLSSEFNLKILLANGDTPALSDISNILVIGHASDLSFEKNEFKFMNINPSLTLCSN
jgi:hypothetical protein